MKARYERLKSLMDMEKRTTKFAIEHNYHDDVPGIHKEYAKDIRDYLEQIDREYPDCIAKPITEAWRTIIDDPDDIALSGYHYRIFKTDTPDEWTDDEIEEYIMDEVGYPPIYSPYDCTGKRFTRWCSWSRQPIGIVMIHAWGTDL